MDSFICFVCGCELEPRGTVACGDGELSDEHYCPTCEQSYFLNTRWSLDGTHWFLSEFNMLTFHAFQLHE